MAKVSEWVDPSAPKLGGLNKNQEREVAALVEENFGLNPEWGWKRNIPNIPGAASRIYGMSDEDWNEILKELPYYGEFQDQDVDAIQEYFLDKYPVDKILSTKIPEWSLPNKWKTIGETYGVGAGVIPSDAAYQKIMSISPDALSGVRVTGLDSYEGPIAETIEYEDPRQQRAVEGVPSFDNTGIYRQDLSISDFKDVGIGDAGKFTRMVESMTTQELFDAGYIDSITKEERDRKDRRHQQGVEAQRRARQYDAIAKRLWT